MTLCWSLFSSLATPMNLTKRHCVDANNYMSITESHQASTQDSLWIEMAEVLHAETKPRCWNITTYTRCYAWTHQTCTSTVQCLVAIVSLRFRISRPNNTWLVAKKWTRCTTTSTNVGTTRSRIRSGDDQVWLCEKHVQWALLVQRQYYLLYRVVHMSRWSRPVQEFRRRCTGLRRFWNGISVTLMGIYSIYLSIMSWK